MVMVNGLPQNEPSEIHGQDMEVRQATHSLPIGRQKNLQVTHSLPIARQNLQVFNESTVNVYNVRSLDNICFACGAFMFKDEKHIGKLSQTDTVTFSICCANGNIKVPPIKNPPDLLKDLLTGNTP